MNKNLRKILYLSLVTLMVTGIGASVMNAHASINPNRYGIDVFPSRKTHQRFAYQLRKHGHNGRVYYASKDSRLGRAIFGRGVPNNDYANYMVRHQHKLFKAITKKLERKTDKRHSKSQKRTRKARTRRHITKHTRRIKRYNRKVRKNRRSKKIENKKRAKQQSALKSRFKRSNNKRALDRSGFYDARAIGGNFIFNKYAPNDKRAVVPKKMNVTNWYQGKFGQKHPTAYYYVPKLQGWIKLSK